MSRIIFLFCALASIAIISSAHPILKLQELDSRFPESSPEITPEATFEPLLDSSPQPLFSTPQPTPLVSGVTSGVTPDVTNEPDAAVLRKELPGTTNPSTEPEPFTAIESSTVTPTPEPLNEGCVAIEHLTGYILQHPEHLRRRVLCAHQFCATPNHAIIVDGIMTSMKRMCANRWQCAESVKLVNNLKISANRRAVVNDHITITPYDLRFPKAASWAAQIAEDIWNILSTSAIAGSVFAILAIIVQNQKKSC